VVKKLIALALVFTFNFMAFNVRAMQDDQVAKEEIKKIKSFEDVENPGNLGAPIIHFGTICAQGAQQLCQKQPEVVKVGASLVFVVAYYWWILGIFIDNCNTLQG